MRADRQRWLRERRASAYVTAIEAAESIRVSSLVASQAQGLDRVYEQLAQLVNSTQGDQPSLPLTLDELVERVEQHTLAPLRPLIHAESEISIFGNKSTYRAIRQLVKTAIALWESGNASYEKDARDKALVAAETELINSARRSYSLRPLKWPN